MQRVDAWRLTVLQALKIVAVRARSTAPGRGTTVAHLLSAQGFSQALPGSYQLEAIRGEKTMAELAAPHIHANQIADRCLKRQILG
jgi:hypothetical protein